VEEYNIEWKVVMMKHTLRLTISVLLVALLAIPASAAVVNTWSYTYDAGFVELNIPSGDFGLATYGLNPITIEDGTAVNSYTQAWWGSSEPYRLTTPRSGIVLGSPVTGQIDTNSAAGAAAMTMTHYNRPIYGSSLTSGTVLAALELTALDPVNALTKVLATSLSFDFYETSNVGNLQSDVFILRNPEVGSGTFEYDGETYALDFTGSFQRISNAYVSLLNLNPDVEYYGWVTGESAVTDIDTSFRITHVPTPTPEPATFVLLALGLGMIGLHTYRRQNAAA
jgi:hypothetical protein